jgi:glycosyltransferase involved in cell wall biosynthesis
VTCLLFLATLLWPLTYHATHSLLISSFIMTAVLGFAVIVRETLLLRPVANVLIEPVPLTGASVPTPVDTSKPFGDAKPLVSILIPAHNSSAWIADTLRSALAQTWPRKEIIVVDDGSTDRTVAIVRRFESRGVRLIVQKNQGASAARNRAFAASRGEFIQWLDADDLLAPDKIAIQMATMRDSGNKRLLLSCGWAMFLYRYYRAEFIPSGLWQDLSPVEWLLRKMGENLYMQTATWLMSRELAEAAGPWDTRLTADDDGEYFCRVLLASDGVRFVPGSKVFYRGPGLAFQSLSHLGTSVSKRRAFWLSMQLHIKYIRSLEDSSRVRAACRRYLQTSFLSFYPDQPEIVRQAKQLARDLDGGDLLPPALSWKYAWVKRIFGWQLAKRAQLLLLGVKWGIKRYIDKLRFIFDGARQREMFARSASMSNAKIQ